MSDDTQMFADISFTVLPHPKRVQMAHLFIRPLSDRETDHHDHAFYAGTAYVQAGKSVAEWHNLILPTAEFSMSYTVEKLKRKKAPLPKPARV